MKFTKNIWSLLVCLLQNIIGGKCNQDEHEDSFNYR